ncbi:MAG: hypothetical protein V1839_01745 [archaeon]
MAYNARYYIKHNKEFAHTLQDFSLAEGFPIFKYLNRIAKPYFGSAATNIPNPGEYIISWRINNRDTINWLLDCPYTQTMTLEVIQPSAGSNMPSHLEKFIKKFEFEKASLSYILKGCAVRDRSPEELHREFMKIFKRGQR